MGIPLPIARELALIAEEIKLRLLWRGRSLHDVLQAFEDFDSDRDGSCACPEAVTTGMGINLEGRKLRSVWRQFEHDESDSIRSANAPSTASIVLSEPSRRRHGRLNFQWVLRLNQRAVPALRVLTNWKVETYIQERRAAGCVSSRDRLYRFLASPTSSGNALMFALLILAFSFASIITFGVESHQHSKQVLSALELYGENATAIEEHLGSLTP
uniref:Uncharacterized protein n=2 Tax=Emiliania huxleyi TaxID=2903 RepID=A0A0D3IMM4_EMIH1